MPKNTMVSGPFVEVSTKLYIHLPPCFATKPVEGIQEQLNGFLMRYMPQVDGVVLAHSDLKLLQSSGRIISDSPYCHFWITVKLLVWKPVKGSSLHGTINLQSPDHIGLLLYGTFNASIPSEFIPKDKYEFNPNSSYSRVKQQGEQEEDASSPVVNGLLNGEWVLKSTGESIGHDGVIEFEVSDLVRTNDMLTVTGSLLKVPVTMRRASMMVKPSPVNEGISVLSDPAQKKRSAPEDEDVSASKGAENDQKRIKKEKKKEKKKEEGKDEHKTKEEKKDKKEKKKEKKEKKHKADA
ncbi:hypothetical protein KVV02_007641 [Mortierella alpina]|uniref:RPA43 OB domain-containing protein n=1 Tax=Mortierella alpina TaxID=64518 RepID=A0A9P8A8U9_MORAP|nr:hypothetical protein KVV02_007641 [Mortierella alpina]